MKRLFQMPVGGNSWHDCLGFTSIVRHLWMIRVIWRKASLFLLFKKQNKGEGGGGASTYHMTFSCNTFSFGVNVAANQSLRDSLATTLKPTFHKDTTQHCPFLVFFSFAFLTWAMWFRQLVFPQAVVIYLSLEREVELQHMVFFPTYKTSTQSQEKKLTRKEDI